MRTRRARERGSITIELVAAVPVVLMAGIIVVQGLVLTSGLSGLQTGAKDAARAWADSCVSGDANLTAVVQRDVPGFVHVLKVQKIDHGTTREVVVTANIAFSVGSLSTPPFEVQRSATMPEVSSNCP